MKTDVEEEEKKQKSFRQVRRTWVPIIKNMLSTAADIVGDWVFYLRVVKGGYGPDLEPWLLSFSVISSFLGGLTVLSLIMNHWSVCLNMHNIHKTRFQKVVHVALLSEMFIEDIPQFVLTWLAYDRRMDGLGPYAVFNITTSGFNFVFNGLDLLMPLEEEHYEEVANEELAEEELAGEAATVAVIN
mmetsp:Transcript_21483/g.32202  ORF Transcript_21483/g.32202 Transcript_21483/m.32202 type:complete len:186 (+) Transcript_21483:155-712(+)